MIQNQQVRNRAAKVKLLLMDVDGVLTNGKLYHFPDAAGNMIETKGFDSQDGIALQWMQWKGLRTGVISGRDSLATAERARQTKINYVYQGHIEKVPILEEIMEKAQLQADEIAYMGDDFTDIVVMRRVGICHCGGQCAAGSAARGALCDKERRGRGCGAGSG